ncbi:unnamed protein product [Somion occarium]|uniref:N-acetyltransferase domain-containing protein n=1 Tax=Somion occarium TaxID=3059160 RepID=A0ABP1D1W8_9APHY
MIEPTGITSKTSDRSGALKEHARQEREPIVPRLIVYGDIPTTTDTTFRTSEGDPLNHYLIDTPDSRLRSSLLKQKWRRFRVNAMWVDFTRKQTAWVIQDGKGFVGMSDPTRRRTVLDRILDPLFRKIQESQVLFYSKEQNNRLKEIQGKLRPLIKRLIGDKQKDMFNLDVLGVDPDFQGRGYGSALVEVVTSMADAHGRDTWLVSSNVEANTGFYNRLGFFTIGEITLGEHNPTWDEPPVVVAVMKREANWKPSFEDEKLSNM